MRRTANHIVGGIGELPLARFRGRRTGIAAFDVWAKELVETGYLHNHARMWFASIWIFTLKLDWRLGADVFLRHLMDKHPAFLDMLDFAPTLSIARAVLMSA